jgi:hypothetical protein
MKKFVIILLVFSSSVSNGQTKQCDCSGPLSRDLTTKITTTEYQNLKEWLYEYFKSDATTQISKKNNTSINWSSAATTFIKGLPVRNQNDAAYSSNEEDETFIRLEQTFSKNHYLSNEQFNQVIAEQMGSNQLIAYLACLKTCEGIAGPGITYNAGGDFSDELYIQVNFKSTPGGQIIHLKGNALYSNLEPIGGLIFKEGFPIKDGQSITQYFKRVDPNKSAMFSFNVVENIPIQPINFDAKPNINTQQIPIGTIVASILSYNSFLQANGLPMDNDMSKAIWIPCDGRVLNSSEYSKFGTVPDLRGVFLRGINDYGISYPGVGNVSYLQKNPGNEKAGVLQLDDFKEHSHNVPGTGAGTTGWALENVGRIGSYPTSPNGGAETRPKNITVYYYIKIN